MRFGRVDFPMLIKRTSTFSLKGSWVVFFIFIQILIEHSVSKQWEARSDAAFCGA